MWDDEGGNPDLTEGVLDKLSFETVLLPQLVGRAFETQTYFDWTADSKAAMEKILGE